MSVAQTPIEDSVHQIQSPEILAGCSDQPELPSYSRSNSGSFFHRHIPPLASPRLSSVTSSFRFLNHCHTEFRLWFFNLIDCISNKSIRSKRPGKWRGSNVGKKEVSRALCLFFCLFFLINIALLWMIQRDKLSVRGRDSRLNSSSYLDSSSPVLKVEPVRLENSKRPKKNTFERLLALAAHALAENKREPKDLWQEPYVAAAAWKPCADLRSWEPNRGKNGYIMITANGGLNQQRVAICNAVVLARLLNSTLVVPKFMFSSVWRDPSQFDDIYQEDYFIDFLSPDIEIVKELPEELRSVNLDAIGSVMTDEVVEKEASPRFYLKTILPILLKNKVVHFVGFGNRLAFDPMPFQLQKLRCRCNFHALHFVPKIQETGALLLERLRNGASPYNPVDHHLVGPYSEPKIKGEKGSSTRTSKYLAVHLRFEIDMVAHSLCEYGGGEGERRELEAYRQIHFPALTFPKINNLPSPEELRADGLCPLSPEEAVLMLAALGFSRKTKIFVAGANVYGGTSRLTALNSLYPNLVTKEKLLSASELRPFSNYSSQLAALDFIASTGADVFAMTDPGSQLSSLVSGYRVYYGGGKMATVRPNKRRLADIFAKNGTIGWRVFEQRVRKAVRQTKHVFQRPRGRSVYRFPRTKECMCRA